MKKFYDKYSWLIILLLVVVILLKTCSGHPKQEAVPVDLKPEIKAQDSIITKFRTVEKVKVVEVVKWKKIEVKHQNDTTPCGTEIRFVMAQADTIFKIDSTLILALKNLHSVDSIIIDKQQVQILKQDTIITKLTRKLKWQKLKTKGVWLAWGIREAVGVGAKIKN